MFRIYNDWLVDFCQHDPARFIGLACLPYGDIDAAVLEIRRVAKLGLRGVELSCSWDMEPMWHPVWEPLWKTIHEVNLPLHFHTFPAVPPRPFTQPEVRAVYVCENGRFVGVLTRKTLVREVVAAGRHPRETTVGQIAEEARWTLDSELPLDEAFQFLEEHDAERVPVVDDGKLVGVLSRSVLQRRLAEDEPPPPLEEG